MDIWNLLAAAAAAHGGRPAVLTDGRDLAYAPLYDRARAHAASLAAAGVARGDRVACLQHNTPAHLQTCFGVAGCGAVLVALNTRLAAAELRAILAHAAARLLVHDADNAELARAAAAGTACRAVDVASLEADACRADAWTPAAVAPDDTAHLYYTSGTTGRPKGVMLTHANVCTHARWAAAELALTGDDRWSHIAPMFHLADAWATFAITMVGGAHAFLPHFTPAGALDLLVRQRITITNLVPTMLQRMVAEPGAAARDYALRAMLSGGAPIARAVVERVIATFGCEYVQTYGMTETSPYLTVSLLDDALRTLPADEQLRLRCRTGRPFGGVELRVVDDAGRPVAADDRAVGEIRVRGPTVTPGYWRDAAATRAAFDADGFLCTGDLATIDARGWVDIVDRKKDVIKTGGESVYSIEVEQVLYRHPAVLECAVYGAPDPDWGEVVAAAVVLRDGATADRDALVAFCREHIAAYKAPRRVDFVGALPRTGSGKIQKAALRRPSQPS